MTNRTDYRNLLAKYMAMIIRIEGTEHLDRSSNWTDNFTEEELDKLDKISNEASWLAKEW